MATFSFKLAGGGGFTTELGAIRDVTPGKKREHAIVHVLWGKWHKKNDAGRSDVVPMKAVGDWKKIKARWKALLSAQQGGR